MNNVPFAGDVSNLTESTDTIDTADVPLEQIDDVIPFDVVNRPIVDDNGNVVEPTSLPDYLIVRHDEDGQQVMEIDYNKLSKTQQKKLRSDIRSDAFKQNRELDKMKKVSRKVKKLMRDVKDPGAAEWQEGQKLSINIYDMLETFNMITKSSTEFANTYESTLPLEVFTEILKLSAIITKDVEELMAEWVTVTKQLDNREGLVDEEDISEYLDIYTELVALQQKIINVVTSNASKLSDKVIAYKHLEKKKGVTIDE